MCVILDFRKKNHIGYLRFIIFRIEYFLIRSSSNSKTKKKTHSDKFEYSNHDSICLQLQVEKVYTSTDMF